MLTANEKRLLRYLATEPETHSINQLAKALQLAPNGAYKILKKGEKENIFNVKTIANIKGYSLNFLSEKTENVLALAFLDNLMNKRVEQRMHDLRPLKKIVKACVIFGSYITLKENPQDIDILFILAKKDFKQYKTDLILVQELMPVKIHDVIQTQEDMKKNRKDPVIINALREGYVVWGVEYLIKVIKAWQTKN